MITYKNAKSLKDRANFPQRSEDPNAIYYCIKHLEEGLDPMICIGFNSSIVLADWDETVYVPDISELFQKGWTLKEDDGTFMISAYVPNSVSPIIASEKKLEDCIVNAYIVSYKFLQQVNPDFYKILNFTIN